MATCRGTDAKASSAMPRSININCEGRSWRVDHGLDVISRTYQARAQSRPWAAVWSVLSWGLGDNKRSTTSKSCTHVEFSLV